MAVVLAVVGAVLISAGFGMWKVPAGLVAGGAQCIVAAYVVAYMTARPMK